MKLVVQNASGIAEVVRTNYITVFPSPTGSLTANQTLGCLPANINFTDLSTPGAGGNITSWEWDFGDGGTSTQQNPTHLFNNIGYYSITLTVTSSNGCKSTTTAGNYIRVVGGVTTDFNFAPPTTCRAPFNVNFTNLSDGPGVITYNWDFGNGTTSTAANPTATYAAPGTYTVILNAVSDLGCTGSQTKTITINPTTTDFTVPANICLNQPVSFQNTSSPAPVTSTWEFGDGTGTSQINPVKTYLTPGPYTVKLINRYAGCIDSQFHNVNVADKPVVAFTVNDNNNCQAPFTVQFTDQTSGATSWLWNFGDGSTSTQQNPSHTYNALGDYDVSLTVTTGTGCSNTLVKPAYIQVRPTTIQLNVPAGGCAPFSYLPNPTITTVDPIATWLWNFGDGTTSTSPTPGAHVYNTPGAYTVSLTLTTQSGCVITKDFVDGVRVGTPGVAAFNPSVLSTCASNPVSFQDLSTFTPGFDPAWLWDFGDGDVSFEQNPMHQFQDTGLLTVRLTIYNNRCQSTTTRVIDVRPPIARWEYLVNCASGLVSFTNTSIVNPALPTTYTWDFGNGTTFNGQTPAPVNLPPGPHTITLTVTNGACTDAMTQNITIAAETATFSFSKNPVCKNDPFTLTSTNTNPQNIRTYKWVIGTDTLPTNGPTITYNLPNVGTYDVTSVLFDINGCVSKSTQQLTVNGPVANFTANAPGACYGKLFGFTDNSTPAANIQNWIFDYGDGIKDTLTRGPFTHTYNLLGAFNVSLTVIDAAGCRDSYTLPNQIIVTNPIVGFRADTFYCPQAPLQFVDTSSGVGLNYLWTFGDGNSSTLQNPTNSYPAGDNDYTVKLKITDINGCSDSVTKTNYIKIRFPKAAFEITDTTTICPPLKTGFLFQGKDYESWVWDFGDGGSSTVQSPSHFYSQFGKFTPTLTLMGPGGCTHSASASVSVYNPAAAQINYGPLTTACNSLNVDFNLVLPAGFKFWVGFGDGTIDSSGRLSFSHFYPRPSLNSPILFMMDTAQGCQPLVVGSPRIDVLGAIPLFGKDKEEFCDNGIVQFRDFTTKNDPLIRMDWNFGDGTTASFPNSTDPSHNYTQPGVYEVNLDVTTQNNCTSSYKDTILVYRTPAPSIISRDTICVNSTEPFTAVLAQTDTLIKYQWTFGNGQTGKDSISSATYNTTGNFPITLTTTNKIGCSANATKTIHVATAPTATPVQNPITLMVGESVPLAMTYTGNLTTYTWQPTTRLSCADCPIPTANPQSTTTYKVDVTDVYGCRASSQVTVNVVCINQNYFVPNTFSPNGDGHNETFFVRGTGLFTVRSLTVFNRWGQIVFDKKNVAVNDPASGWNGIFNGQKASPDVYVYIMEILCANGQVVPVKGNVTLLR